jgi:hypothetical protein
MKTHHFLILFLIVLVSYLVGSKYPSTGSMLLGKIGLG